jgi:nucleotide-binding universal stress UspA family protein
MSADIRSIAVHVDRTDASANRTKLAADLADRFGAQLTGATAGVPYLPSYAPFGETFIALQPEIVDVAHKQLTTALDEAETTFRAASTVSAPNWRRSKTCDAATFLAFIARSADLLVVGRPVDKDPDGVLGLNPSDLVMTAGRPVLIAAPEAARLSAARIVVGWKDTRESRLAVADAMPFLTRAEEVFIVAAGVDDDGKGAAEVAAWLGTHGVTAKSVVEDATDRHAAETLLAAAKRVNADLIVAGAFGHSRAREWIFGGVTRSLLGDASVSVLLSH